MTDNTSPSSALGHLGTAAKNRIGAAVPIADFWIFVFLLVLAIVGAGISSVDDQGGHLYWSWLVLAYGVVCVIRSWFLAKDQGASIWPIINTQILHWLGALVTIQLILFFEAGGMTDRGPAADYALLVLALSTFLAGVHFNWTYMVLGAILAVIAVALQELEQLTIYIVTLPLALGAIWIVYKRKFG